MVGNKNLHTNNVYLVKCVNLNLQKFRRLDFLFC